MDNVCEMSTLFGIAETAKMISPMNYSIIATELKKLSDFLTTSSSNYSSAKIAFPKDLFDGDYNYVPENSFQNKTENEIRPEEKKNDKPADISQGQNILIKDTSKATPLERKEIQKVVSVDKTVKDKNNRQDVILGMLKGGAKLTVKDFAQNIKGCSEKTIQRELINMVSMGLLKKEGERRWSRYFLKQ